VRQILVNPEKKTVEKPMAKKSDWMPGNRQEVINMAQNWVTILQRPESKTWGVPNKSLDELTQKTKAADVALDVVTNRETKTPVASEKCSMAMEALSNAMRDIKKRWFHDPPLDRSDLVSLGLKPKDPGSTKTGAPTGQVSVTTYLIGRSQLGIKIIYISGTADNPAHKAYRIWYNIVEQGETPPTRPEELRKHFFTKRKKDVIEFTSDDSGKMVYFAVQIENEGKKGPWGPMTSAIIP
jgi:hypothetical protein